MLSGELFSLFITPEESMISICKELKFAVKEGSEGDRLSCLFLGSMCYHELQDL